MYQSKGALAKFVCEKLGFTYSVQFVEAMRRNNKIYVRGTAGKPHEYAALKSACESNGFIYK